MRALVAEHNAKVGHFVAHLLREEGHQAEECWTGTEALRLIRLGGYGLAVVDAVLTPIDGFTVIREARSHGIFTPILMLGARESVANRVRGLESGADDFITQPFHVAELLARVRALLRRPPGPSTVVCGELEVHRMERRVTLSGKPLRLTARELSMIVNLADRQGTVVRRAELVAAGRDGSSGRPSNAVDVHLCHLRAKLGEQAWMIETVRGKGYRLRPRRGDGEV